MAENRLTALFRATIAQLTDVARSILLQVDNPGNSILHAAASSGSDEILDQVLSDPYRSSVVALVDLQRGTDKATALHLTARNGQLRCLQLLIVQGQANMTLSNIHGSNALHLALQQTFNVEKLADVFLKHTPKQTGMTPSTAWTSTRANVAFTPPSLRVFLASACSSLKTRLYSSTRRHGKAPGALCI